MSGHRNKPTRELASLYSQFLARQSEEWRKQCAVVCRERARKLDRLRKLGVITISDLLERLAGLSAGLKRLGIELTSLLEIRQAVPVLLELMSDRDVRVDCAVAIYLLGPGKNASRRFIEIGNRELASNNPDRRWLQAIIHGLAGTDEPAGVELLVTIFERRDLPGWLRGDAADKLGYCEYARDRRRKLFLRCRDTALFGLKEKSIDVQFGSMYLIGTLCCYRHLPGNESSRDFATAIPVLRRIAKHDRRLAPGFWWPMSAEAEDVIGCIQTGGWPQPDAAERWLGNTKRGQWNRD